MTGWTGWDWAILGTAAYVAVVTLARLMANHRQQYLRKLQSQIELERRKKALQAAAEQAAKESSAKAA